MPADTGAPDRDPRARAHDQTKADVVNGIISIDAARKIYGLKEPEEL